LKINCVGVGAAWNTANVHSGSTVAVFGLGAVGLAVSQKYFLLFFSLQFYQNIVQINTRLSIQTIKLTKQLKLN